MLHTSKQCFEVATRFMPGGVSSPVRAFKGVGGTPLVFERGQGAHIFDVEGNQYVDFVLSWGPLILGHAYPPVVESILNAARKGTSFGATCPLEIELAQLIVGAFDSIDLVRFVSSGTEATMSAIRVARGFTGRTKIIKFEGGFHGHSDMLLAKAGSGVATLDIPDSAGVPAAATQNTISVPYNNPQAVASAFAEHPNEIAAIIIEPIAGNMGFIRPKPEFLQTLRNLCDENHALLIFDEVMTGFRAALPGVQTLYGVMPDLTCLGKVIGGGLPVAAYGGRRDIMSQLAPIGAVYQSGTLSGNPLGMAAGIATLQEIMQPKVFDEISRSTSRFSKGFQESALRGDVSLQIDHSGTMFGFYFLKEPTLGNSPVSDFSSARNHVDTARYSRFFHDMRQRGFYFAPSAFEAGFMSRAHSDDIIDSTLQVIDEVFSSWRVG